MTDCPCGTGNPITDCCGRYIANLCPAPTAEALMRSRYTAYTLADTVYLQKTSDVGVFDAAVVRRWATRVTWLGLNVRQIKAGAQHDDVGEVDYIARYRENGQEKTIAENALFRKIKGGWCYIGSKPRHVTERSGRVGRNDPCPCASGKKFKKCCGNT